MAEILRALYDDEVETFQPVQQLPRDKQIEVYEATGSELLSMKDLYGNCNGSATLLLLLSSDELVRFSYTTGENIEIAS